MNKKKLLIIISVLILFAGLIAVTQESDHVLENHEIIKADELSNNTQILHPAENSPEKPRWVQPLRWFVSNSGGMAVNETPTRSIALRNEYALSVEFVQTDKLPVYLYPFYSGDYFIESRMLYENGRHIRTQWILRDAKGTSRVVGVFIEPDIEQADDNVKEHVSGFIEIYNERSFLINEYRYFKNGARERIDFSYNNDLLVNSALFLLDENSGQYAGYYTDYFRYNRSLFLRAIERVFYKDSRISLSRESLSVSFPRNLSDAAHIKELIGEKLNTYPGFFGEVNVYENEKIVYVTDDRSRITNQTLYDEEGNIIWVITNTWAGERIISTLKKESNLEQLAEFEYDSSGSRIAEKNYKNGILERVVRTEGNIDIEELYYNNNVILRAVWEDGRKISETRVDNR